MSGGNADDYEEMSEVDPKLFSARRGRNVPFAVLPEVLGENKSGYTYNP